MPRDTREMGEPCAHLSFLAFLSVDPIYTVFEFKISKQLTGGCKKDFDLTFFA